MTTRTRPASLRLAAVLLLAALLASPAVARAQGSAADIARYFRVEVSPNPVPRGGWAVEGYVYSTHPYRVNGVRVRVEVLDEAGNVIHQATGWVAGDVPSGGRAHFYVSVPGRGASYRAQVLSFFLVSREAL